jgi:MoaA/NifB/PqqE/SkfB family radical SAM enzyme
VGWLFKHRPASLAEALAPVHLCIDQRTPLSTVLRAMETARDPLTDCLRSRLLLPGAARVVAIKLLNVLLAKYEYQSRSQVLASRPLGLIVDPANGCNLACPGCVHSGTGNPRVQFDWPNGLLSEDRLAALLKEYGPYAFQVTFCNYGEPTANLKTPRFIEMANAYHCKTVLSTNLTVRRFDADAYVNSGLDFMRLSVDGATQETYGKFRRNGNIEHVFENIRKLVEAKNRLGRPAPILGWQFLAFEHNAHEIPAALEKAKELGVDQFMVATPFDVSWDDPEVRISTTTKPETYDLNPHIGEDLQRNFGHKPVDNAATVIDRAFVSSWSDTPTSSNAPSESAHTCSWLYKNMVMDANGRVMPCCSAPEPDANVVFAQFPDNANPYNSELYQRARRFFANGMVKSNEAAAPYCEECTWNQEHTEICAEHVADYLRTSGRELADEAAIEALANW